MPESATATREATTTRILNIVRSVSLGLEVVLSNTSKVLTPHQKSDITTELCEYFACSDQEFDNLANEVIIILTGTGIMDKKANNIRAMFDSQSELPNETPEQLGFVINSCRDIKINELHVHADPHVKVKRTDGQD